MTALARYAVIFICIILVILMIIHIWRRRHETFEDIDQLYKINMVLIDFYRPTEFTDNGCFKILPIDGEPVLLARVNTAGITANKSVKSRNSIDIVYTVGDIKEIYAADCNPTTNGDCKPVGNTNTSLIYATPHKVGNVSEFNSKAYFVKTLASNSDNGENCGQPRAAIYKFDPPFICDWGILPQGKTHYDIKQFTLHINFALHYDNQHDPTIVIPSIKGTIYLDGTDKAGISLTKQIGIDTFDKSEIDTNRGLIYSYNSIEFNAPSPVKRAPIAAAAPDADSASNIPPSFSSSSPSFSSSPSLSSSRPSPLPASPPPFLSSQPPPPPQSVRVIRVNDSSIKLHFNYPTSPLIVKPSKFIIILTQTDSDGEQVGETKIVTSDESVGSTTALCKTDPQLATSPMICGLTHTFRNLDKYDSAGMNYLYRIGVAAEVGKKLTAFIEPTNIPIISNKRMFTLEPDFKFAATSGISASNNNPSQVGDIIHDGDGTQFYTDGIEPQFALLSKQLGGYPYNINLDGPSNRQNLLDDLVNKSLAKQVINVKLT